MNSVAVRIRLRVLLGAVVMAAGPAYAQSSTATLSGIVIDQSNAVIPDVAITILAKATGFQREATTNNEGQFTFAALQAGRYSVRAERQGFTPVQVPDLTLNVNDSVSIRLQLRVARVGEEVTVLANPGRVSTSPAVSTVVDRQFVENLPMNGRSFQSLIALTPGIVLTPTVLGTNADGQFSVNGQRAESNAFLVDGVSGNYGAAPGASQAAQTGGNLPGLTAFGTTQSLVSIDAMQEFRVQTSTYSAEYGRQPGGQISIITRSGTNQFHGSAYDYVRNDIFDANNWFANQAGLSKAAVRQNNFGGTLGGPFVLPAVYDGRNQTFFFFSYEGLRLRQPTFALTNVPTQTLRQQAPTAVQPILNAFPVANGRDLGNGLAELRASYSNPSSLDAISLRIDHALGSRLNLFGRYNEAPSETASRSTGNLNLSNLRRIETTTLTLGGTALLTPRFSAELRGNYSDNYAFSGLQQGAFGGAVPLTRSILVPAAYDSSSAQGVAVLRSPGQTSPSLPTLVLLDRNISSQRQYNVVGSVSYLVRSHRLKLGVDYRRLTPVTAVNSYRLQASFRNTTDILNALAGTNNNIQTTLPTRPVFTNLSLFGQDTWDVSSRLSLDLGVRWDVNPAPGEADGNEQLAVTQITDLSTMELTPRGTPAWKTTYSNFAPRLGAAYQLRQQRGWETVLRSGVGMFYDTGNNQGARQFSNFPFTARRNLATVTFPLDASIVAPPALPALQATVPPPYGPISVFDPHLKLPYTLHYNVAVEQAVGSDQSLTVSYVGASGRRLLQMRRLLLASQGINPNFTDTSLITNAATSSYDSLQVQFQRRLSHGLQALVSYTWSHAVDEDSASFTQRTAQRGNADFDVRHNFAAAFTYELPSPRKDVKAFMAFRDWAIDGAVHVQSALPVDIIAANPIDLITGDAVNVRPNVVPNVPLYVDCVCPGGRAINAAAFTIPAPGQSGNLGRNVVRGFPASQLDLALRRQVRLTQRVGLQLRAEAFNVFNHPNFGTIQTDLTAANFGQATNMLSQQLGGISQLYQIGGPRSIQLTVRVQF